MTIRTTTTDEHMASFDIRVSVYSEKHAKGIVGEDGRKAKHTVAISVNGQECFKVWVQSPPTAKRVKEMADHMSKKAEAAVRAAVECVRVRAVNPHLAAIRDMLEKGGL